MDPLKLFLQEAGFTPLQAGQGDIRTFIAGLIQIALSLVGLVFFIIILYGGFMWLTAGGNDEKISRAKKLLTSGIIGFAVTLAAFIITITVARVIYQATVPVDTFTPGGLY